MLLPQRKLFPFPARRPARFYAYTKIYSTAEYLLEKKNIFKKKIHVILLVSFWWNHLHDNTFPLSIPYKNKTEGSNFSYAARYIINFKNNLFMD